MQSQSSFLSSGVPKVREPCFCHAVGVVSKDGMETVSAEITLHWESVGLTFFPILNSAIPVHSCHFILNSIMSTASVRFISLTPIVTHVTNVSKHISAKY